MALPLPSAKLEPAMKDQFRFWPPVNEPGTGIFAALSAFCAKSLFWPYIFWPYSKSSCTPSKCVFMMKLTTPATASAPYVADAPPVRTSMRSIIPAGIWLTSGLEALIRPAPGCMRRPLISTRVR